MLCDLQGSLYCYTSSIFRLYVEPAMMRSICHWFASVWVITVRQPGLSLVWWPGKEYQLHRLMNSMITSVQISLCMAMRQRDDVAQMIGRLNSCNLLLHTENWDCIAPVYSVVTLVIQQLEGWMTFLPMFSLLLPYS